MHACPTSGGENRGEEIVRCPSCQGGSFSLPPTTFLRLAPVLSSRVKIRKRVDIRGYLMSDFREAILAKFSDFHDDVIVEIYF